MKNDLVNWLLLLDLICSILTTFSAATIIIVRFAWGIEIGDGIVAGFSALFLLSLVVNVLANAGMDILKKEFEIKKENQK